jgi:predicted unusual protein kinase regulating ubiquinone biosynthesis (AarF/ABC1/UbiB family)
LQLPLIREAKFAGGLSSVYGKLKLNQARNALLRHVANETEEKRARRWEHVHDRIGIDLYDLCASLGGAYVKVGQFFSTRPDLVPEPWCRHLVMLCDAVQPMASEQARDIALREIFNATHGKQTLADWCDQPLGAASVAQVHAARLIPTDRPPKRKRLHGNHGRMVAVKVRRPEAATFFARDFAAVQKAASFVQRFELSFDLLSCIEDLRDRVSQELDFRIEHDHLVRSRKNVRKASRGAIATPEPILGTRECTITELLDSVPVSALARQLPQSDSDEVAPKASVALPRGAGGVLARSALSKTVIDLFDVYGNMVLCTSTFHADPHPGNLLVPRRFARKYSLSLARNSVPSPLRGLLPYAPARLHLIDWGQCGGFSPVRRKQLARLFLELADAGDVDFEKSPAAASRVAGALRDLGVVHSGERNDGIEAKAARGMFDSIGEIDLEETDLNELGISEFPKDLFLVLRVTQILRGLSSSAENLGAPPKRSLAKTWRPYAKRALAYKEPHKR